MIPLPERGNKSYEEQDLYRICRKKFHSDENDEKYRKVKDHCHYTEKSRGSAHNNCNLRHTIPKEIRVVIHNGSTYDFHFIINQLAEEFKGEFDCIGEKWKNILLFQYPLKKNVITVKQFHTN